MATTIKMPSVTLSFTDAAKTLVTRTDRGIIGMILKGTVPSTNPTVITEESEIPSSFTAANKLQIQYALKGYGKSPQKIIVYMIATAAEDYSAALSYFETCMINYLVAPTATTDKQADAIKTWVIAQRAESNIVKAVLPDVAADDEGIIDVATDTSSDGTNTFTAEGLCGSIAGILATTPLSMSATYAPLPWITSCAALTKADMDTAVGTGKLIVFWDGEKVKIGRAVNSLITTSDTKGEAWKKIRIVEAMDLIRYDITKIAEDTYIGRFANSYQNKLMLVGAIAAYFDELAVKGVLEQVTGSLKANATVELDVTAIKEYLTAHSIDYSGMTDQQIKEHDTGDYVYIKATIKILDAIEDIVLPITI